MNPGEDALLVDKGLKKKWRWAWVEEIGKDSKHFGSSCKKLRESGACFYTCARESYVMQLAVKKYLDIMS